MESFDQRYKRETTSVLRECKKLRVTCDELGLDLATHSPPGKTTVYTTIWAVNRIFGMEGPKMSDVADPLLSKLPNIRRWGRKLLSYGPPRAQSTTANTTKVPDISLDELQEAMEMLQLEQQQFNERKL